jgi:hypothetical protein
MKRFFKRAIYFVIANMIALTVSVGANAGDYTDAITNALQKRFSDFQSLDEDFGGEVTFYTAKWHMSCRYKIIGADAVRAKVTLSKCRVIHG